MLRGLGNAGAKASWRGPRKVSWSTGGTHTSTCLDSERRSQQGHHEESSSPAAGRGQGRAHFLGIDAAASGRDRGKELFSYPPTHPSIHRTHGSLLGLRVSFVSYEVRWSLSGKLIRFRRFGNSTAEAWNCLTQHDGLWEAQQVWASVAGNCVGARATTAYGRPSKLGTPKQGTVARRGRATAFG